MRAVLLLTVLAVAAPVRPERPPPPAEQPKPLQEQIQGQWVVVKRVIEGKDATDGDGYIIAGDTMHHHDKDGAMNDPPMRFRLDTSVMPTAMDIVSKRGVNFDIKAIVKIEGDTLTICYALGETRPLEFAAPPMQNSGLVHLKRVPK